MMLLLLQVVFGHVVDDGHANAVAHDVEDGVATVPKKTQDNKGQVNTGGVLLHFLCHVTLPCLVFWL